MEKTAKDVKFLFGVQRAQKLDFQRVTNINGKSIERSHKSIGVITP